MHSLKLCLLRTLQNIWDEMLKTEGTRSKESDDVPEYIADSDSA